MKRFLIACSIVTVAVMSLTACGDPMQKFNDAGTTGTNDEPAEVGTMPDGFSNFATKCDHGNRVYVTYHGTQAATALSVVPNDPTCAGS